MQHIRFAFHVANGSFRLSQLPLRESLRCRSRLLPNRKASTHIKSSRLPQTPARTRFAPSPTGNLHLGSIRTALFNYLLAKRTNGQFILRIEDTDQKRTIPGAEEKLFEDLKWAGLHWDEGPVIGGQYGPYRQSERIAIHQHYVEALIKSRKAYRCFCSSERLDQVNRHRHDKGLSLGYDRKCIEIPLEEAETRAQDGQAHVIRFRAPQQWPKYTDLVYGKTGHGSERIKKLLVEEPVYEDPILIKSDRFPTYHWANICDDHDMRITHVVRGTEWMSSTPLHIALYQALDWTPPSYAHVPLLVDANRQKLSKRNFGSDIASFKMAGIFPEVLLNFAALLGWSHQQRKDVFDLSELEGLFDLKITKGNTIVSFDKLRYLQEHHARRRVNEAGQAFEQMIRDVAVAMLNKYGASSVMSFLGRRKLRDVVAAMLRAESLSYRSAEDFADQCSMFLIPSQLKTPLGILEEEKLQHFRAIAAAISLIPQESWTKANLRSNLLSIQVPDIASTQTSEEKRLWKKDLYHYLRWALLAGVAGPSIPETMEILGQANCTKRLQDAAFETKALQNMATKPVLSTLISSNN